MKYRSAFVLPKMVALFLVILLFKTIESNAQVLINEVVASNSSGISDEDGDFPDWIELYNSSGNTINLQGYGISDDPENPFKYVLPDIELLANEYYLLFASDKNRGSNSDNEPKFWETIVRIGDAAKYIVPSTSVLTSWVSTDFDDSSWQDGMYGFGYGDNDDNTIVPNGTISVFTRTTFSIEDPSLINDMLLHIDFDDGYVAYLNGVEISRFNMMGDSPLPYNAGTTDFISDPWLVRGEELPAIELESFKDLLVNGENVLAIQVHNTNAESSDMSLIPFLSISRNEQPLQSRGVAEQVTIPVEGLSYPHLNFKLSSSGETLFLTNPDSVLVDQLSFPLLLRNESFGRSIENNSDFLIFQTPTPLSENNTEGYSSRLSEPEMSLPQGFYRSGTGVSIQGDIPGDQVYFTTDGSDPTINSEVFGSNNRVIFSTTTYKLRAFADGSLPSKVVTKTFVIDANQNLPVVSVSTDPVNLWSNESGIYVEGTNGVEGNCTGPRNWNQDWEIPVQIELFESNGELGFSSGAGAKIFGGCSRTNPAKSLSIFFRGEYGNPELNYKLFEEKDIETFQAFVLRNSGNDFTSQGHSMFRDGLMKTLVEDADLDYQAFRPAVMYLNGEYWGIHNIREKVNEHFIESNSNADSEEIDLLEGNGWAIHGNADSYNQFLSALGSANMSNSTEYQQVEDMIDIDNYIDYMAAQIYYANTDWPGNNIKFWRDQRSNGKWRWIIYDTDFGFGLSYGGNVNHNTLNFALESNGPDWPNPSWSTYVFRRMVESPVFVTKFVNRMSDLMNTTFKTEYVNQVIDSLSGKIESEIPRHISRWGNSEESWNDQINILRDFADNRPNNMQSFLMNRFDLFPMSTISVNTSNSNHGIVKVNRAIPESYPWEGRYFREFTIPLTAIPKRGYRFTGWSGDSNSLEYSIEGDTRSEYTANFEPVDGEIKDIVINEIMYNDSEENESGDWIELYNSADYDIDLSGWKIKDEDNSHEFTFTSGTEIESGSYIVIASDLEAFNSQYELTSGLYGELGYNLAGGSDQVRLFDSSGFLVDSLEYQDEFPWDINADGTGFTLELKSAGMDNAQAQSWAASAQDGGTPGTANTVLVSNDEERMVPTEISLLQNYPNPFNPSTTISFQLPEQSFVNLSVFDMLGRKVSVLVEDSFQAGEHNVNWNASQFSSGVYFYRLQVGNDIQTRRMLLLK